MIHAIRGMRAHKVTQYVVWYNNSDTGEGQKGIAIPAFVIVPSQRRSKTGELDATLCDPGPGGTPDRRTAVPVRVKRINGQLPLVDGEKQSIISCEGMNGITTYLTGFKSQRLRNRTSRRQLAQGLALLDKARDVLLPLKNEEENPGLVEALGTMYSWIARERERLGGSR